MLPDPPDDPFARLCAEAAACRLCPALADRAAVLSERNGSLSPRVLIVAEAPGRRGADRTRVPMTGDASGRVFDRLLLCAGLSRADVFITNAVLCNPRTETGANRPPTQAELRNCSPFLRRTIDALDPPMVVAVGAAALGALGRIEPHGLRLADHVARCVAWYGRVLVPVYHPSPQVIISRRSVAEQEADWRAVGGYAGSMQPRRHGAHGETHGDRNRKNADRTDCTDAQGPDRPGSGPSDPPHPPNPCSFEAPP